MSCIPFPPLSATHFGLVQETLARSPFRLLLACIFLNKTRGSVALPVFYDLMTRYPTPSALADANFKDVVDVIQHLGLQNQRANTCINLAKAWLEREPVKDKRWRVLHYPSRGDGKDLKPDEVIDDKDERVAWEVGQLPGVGVYAIDSWRIFCRDELRGLPTGLPNKVTEETKDEEIRKEWTRVLPLDKELRAYLRWRWLRNGIVWDPLTGEKRAASSEEMETAGQGGVIYEGESTGVVIAEGKSADLNNLLDGDEPSKLSSTDIEGHSRSYPKNPG
jgi:methyl-CpG-binding domain protein 4